MATQRHWLVVEPLRGTPTTFTLELVWGNVKGTNWPTSAPTPSTKPTPQRTPAGTGR
jgi:hypothetical protein